MHRNARVTAALVTLGTALTLGAGAPLGAQWSTTYEQFYLQASHNWQFRKHYASADRLFNAFDFGHAILYETLWRSPNAPTSELEEKRYDQLTKKVLVNPPRLPLEEGAIEPKYAQLAPEAKVMFDWAHLLHRQLYDVLADERMDWPAKDAEVARLVGYYKTRRDLAFSSRPKTMRLMQEQPYSLAFRKRYPKFNGLIWGYHWLQMGLYEPLIVGTSVSAKQAGVRATVARFFQMLSDAPNTLPHQMPMTVAVAPQFAARYPEAAIIFDNLHSMHDVVSDILANPSVPRGSKRAEILKAARAYRDDTTEIMSVQAWRVMSEQMGIENMGGASVGFLPVLPTPTVTAGAVMQHDQSTGAMTRFAFGAAVGGEHAGMDHSASAAPTSSVAAAWTESDVAFLQGMRVRSAQAFELSALVAARSTQREILEIAERITAAARLQRDAASQWLGERALPLEAPTDAHAGHNMPGMATPPASASTGLVPADQVAALADARGSLFDGRYLQAMITHHEGSLALVAQLRAGARSAREPRFAELLGAIVATHTLELARLRALQGRR